jgi:hemerythrin-like metal-binding protein
MLKELKISADISMDREHSELVEIINRPWELVNSNFGQDTLDSEIIELSNKLMTHIKEHFSYEHELMNVVNFPSISLHIDEHNMFIKKLLMTT